MIWHLLKYPLSLLCICSGFYMLEQIAERLRLDFEQAVAVYTVQLLSGAVVLLGVMLFMQAGKVKR